ncbi:hypothetical protein LOAG_18972 [Loa loa]|uniref:CCHC-type domain-containing protein n=1 Tax=Loa loa TaxID=7209 RepID=A0A1I7VP81_LOALO|nr:hypothetical protein LOAG_18972 [Loa loa]EJD73610.1 hypothetical protein LOAG_18972 [Loa loa]
MTKFKLKRLQRSVQEETTALSTISQSGPDEFKDISKSKGLDRKNKRRPSSFFNKDHWDSECETYPTFKQRLERLIKTNACKKCLKAGHAEADCKKSMKYFYCRRSHKPPSATIDGNNSSKPDIYSSKKEKSNRIMGQLRQTRSPKVLLLCKVVTVYNAERTEYNEALVLFDSSQLSFVSKKLANRLKLEEMELKELKASDITRYSLQ